jgi:uncharacterized membrane protein
MTPKIKAAEPPLFTAVLTPHRSLTPSGFMLVMMALVACSFIAGLAFWMMGAWPVVGFFGLDIALVQLAFRMNYRAARAAEEIELTPSCLTVRKVTPGGRATEAEFNPFWTKLEIDRVPEIGVVALRLASHGRRVSLGSFLGPAEKEDFAEAFGAALAKARAPAAG